MKIILDVYGGDYAPVEIVKGCVDAINSNSDLEVIMTGNEDEIKSELKKYAVDLNKIEIIDAKEIITNDDSPTGSIKSKLDSSLVKALDALKNRDDVCGMISAGNTGAVLTGGVLKIGRLPKVSRPALAPIIPTRKNPMCLIDGGSNMDCKPEYLVQFALMGSGYMKAVFGIENPRVGLLSVGVEDSKGNALVKEAHELLKVAPINFLGNMEARDAVSGDYDVIVCDGFAGNVLLKSIEGTASMVLGKLKEAIMSSTSAKIGSLFMKKSFKKLKSSMDYHALGGAPFLGLQKILVKAHGSSNALSIKSTLEQVYKMASANMIASVKSDLEKLNS